MTRSRYRLAPLALLALAALAGCQDYNFSPVNQCLIQPGTERVTLSDNSTADILFVVDDSGSMGGKQQSLKDSFDAFVNTLKQTNVDRVTAQLEPIDFHIGITTTSVFINNPKGGVTCQTGCIGASGQVCCDANFHPLTAPRPCTGDPDCAAAGGPWTCKTTNLGLAGEKTCGDAAGNPLKDPVTCATLGKACGELQDRYKYTHGPRTCSSTADCRAPYNVSCKSGCSGAPATGSFCCNALDDALNAIQCDPGVADQTGVAPWGENTLYPRGDFVKAATSTSGPPPRVIHFDKGLFCARTDPSKCDCTHAGSPTICDPPVVNTAEIDKRIAWFKANVLVGTCGSPQEMGLEAGRRALKKALRLDGLAQPADVLPAEWPHAKSKLVTVWVGDEDDCSTPESASAGVIMTLPPAVDACIQDRSLPLTDQRLFQLDVFDSFFTGLGRPLATGFIVSATGTPPPSTPPDLNTNDCQDASCQQAICVDPSCSSASGLCGGQAPGVRFLELATDFRNTGSDVIVGSICAKASDGTLTSPPTAPTPIDFSSILDRVAKVVKQPAGLQLPTQPASAALTILRIVGTDGKTRKTCSAAAPIGTTDVPNPITGAVLNDYDWWFTDGNDLDSQVPTGASRFIYINHTFQRCEANPGETYSADYLGLVPVGGCLTAAECEAAFGVPPTWKTSWQCVTDTGALPTPTARGTCICGR